MNVTLLGPEHVEGLPGNVISCYIVLVPAAPPSVGTDRHPATAGRARSGQVPYEV
jgi:hypothetical protein